MNILFLSRPILDPIKGGIERVTILLVKYLCSKHNIFYMCLEKEIYKNYIPEIKTFFFPNKDINSIENYNFLQEFILKNNIDVIINQCGLTFESNLFLSAKICSQISVIHNDPLVLYNNYFNYTISQHGLQKILRIIFYPFFKKKYYLNRVKHLKYVVNNSDKVIVLSPKYKNCCKILNNNNTITIPNPATYVPSTNFDYSVKKNKFYMWVECRSLRKVLNIFYTHGN